MGQTHEVVCFWSWHIQSTFFSLWMFCAEVVLMSRYSAGTIKAALDRVAAVVFASVVGPHLKWTGWVMP